MYLEDVGVHALGIDKVEAVASIRLGAALHRAAHP